MIEDKVRLEFMGVQALLLRLPEEVPIETGEALDRLLSLRAALLRELEGVDGIEDITIGYRSVAVYARFEDVSPDDVLARARRAIQGSQGSPVPATRPEAVVTLPVVYGGSFGPDLDAVAERAGLSPQDVIRLHQEAVYRVAMIGFSPGFAYLIGLPEPLRVPRRETPRSRVERGSVGIAGFQTGVYSFATPGGWQIIGRTPVALFDVHRPSPSLLSPGDEVRFEAVTEEEYHGRFGAYT
ncbi:5-oxoprolinase subunit PxpB [Alicyclobacillus acidocaldarius]|uniref:Allophanate hydrolase subunit 1 n=1 Tax=Alicyclobacillus acidocaldarius subsp. acidocaldarius (strain ATCC 27009 / DSM 446 / BCRC 14685 / JCM 5260 / KCTC 1825 / NBRC 15652 / NCIMB 11725 / NRRL B-14509 / 104-IA) TaxID=521098 RepID=C8WUH8_ALIAD|nr:5-oxoprolinase subunit PxpB [Alicyclobacillus acidocaldarius]ACV59794.1 Allophanate hydrolase subunit 1 [Alicyclobacillus acidocaldarius subsp. acidocaldarius DSM 446]